MTSNLHKMKQQKEKLERRMEKYERRIKSLAKEAYHVREAIDQYTYQIQKREAELKAPELVSGSPVPETPVEEVVVQEKPLILKEE